MNSEDVDIYKPTASPSNTRTTRSTEAFEDDLELGDVGDTIKVAASESDNHAKLDNDVYSMFFLSKIGGHAFYYAAYIFSLKMSLFTFIALDLFEDIKPSKPRTLVMIAQFLILPVAVAMQEDLIESFFLIANVKYSSTVMEKNPGAYRWKWRVACMLRLIDGTYSLLINYVVLLQATDVLGLFLNFAALQFLQKIDDVALQLAANGYLTGTLEKVALDVQATVLPRKTNKFYTSLDSVLFLSTLTIMLVGWVVYHFA